jgi:3-hydroxy-9,10-secoandrosta-1,3,5(10)-triene-9,17-dione monooxygenase reductase component
MMDTDELRRVFGLFTTGVTVVTAVTPAQEPVGVTANSVTSVSLDPPLMLWCLANKSRSLAAFVEGAPFAINILAADQSDIALRFARSGEAKFDVEDRRPGPGTPPVVRGALARIVCRVTQRHPGGDHTIIVGQVESLESRSAPPLVFHGGRFGRFTRGQDAAQVDSWPGPEGSAG